MAGTGQALKVQPRANYPHVRRLGEWIFVSGTSSRRADNSFAGVEVDALGTTRLDVGAQTEAVIENIREKLIAVGAGLEHLVEVTCYLVDMNDFGAFNAAYNKYFNAVSGPCRTTVAVHQLPHPHLRVEISARAYVPAGLPATGAG